MTWLRGPHHIRDMQCSHPDIPDAKSYDIDTGAVWYCEECRTRLVKKDGDYGGYYWAIRMLPWPRPIKTVPEHLKGHELNWEQRSNKNPDYAPADIVHAARAWLAGNENSCNDSDQVVMIRRIANATPVKDVIQ